MIYGIAIFIPRPFFILKRPKLHYWLHFYLEPILLMIPFLASVSSSQAMQVPGLSLAPIGVSLSSQSAPTLANFVENVTGGTPPYSYAWDFGNGDNSTSGPTASDGYNNPGSYTVKVKVTDSTGMSASNQATFSLSGPPPPMISISSNVEINSIGQDFIFTIKGGNLTEPVQVYRDGILWKTVSSLAAGANMFRVAWARKGTGTVYVMQGSTKSNIVSVQIT